ncbi:MULTISPECIES: hypothetical protein [unclassified Microbacterium]|uniref:hypothetical protein n=1 Tax=unclassified Microbacterium TaxID=2609290 RepID=UPI000EAA3123|nr:MULTISPECIES: hypothetical protein [unclassified Microbacterium]MBT2486622.1 hypothetical protein [Microbacterium sp. ISL-108]RKN69307.1 hypothetical protein D7252_18150 [Microbacterium sp. CGR2]
MPTYEDPSRDADELAEAARGLAYATRQIKTPEDTYEVLGSLHLTLSRLQQGLQQLAAWHQRHGQFASTDDGDRAAGHAHAVRASALLTAAALSVENATGQVMAAHSENGRIAWQPDRHIAAAPNQLTALADIPAEREETLDPEPPANGHSNQSRGLSR